MNYCGRCGSANGTTARFCRQCGIELSGQAAFSSLSTPLNVEFSVKPGMKESQKESKPTPDESTQTSAIDRSVTNNPQENAQKAPQEAAQEAEGSTQDPVAISKSLRRVRASGSLIIEASKKQRDQMNEIIAQAIEGFEARKNEPDQPEQIPAQATDRPATVSSARPSASQTGIAVATQKTPRKTVKPVNATLTVSNPGVLSHAGQLPANGPSSVLAQASGLNPKPGFGSKFRVGLIILGLLVASGSYFVLRDRLLTPTGIAKSERVLMRVEDQSAQYIQVGERYRESGNYDSAQDQFQRALELTPNNPNVHFLIAQTFSNNGQIDEAFKAYKALLRIAPEHLEARLQVAQIYRARGNWNAAYQEYQRIIALDQNSSQAAVALEAIEAHQAGIPEPLLPNTPASRRLRATLKKSPVLPPLANAQAQISLLPQKLVSAPMIRPPADVSSEKAEDKPDPQAMADTRKRLGLRYLHIREYRAAINEFLAALRLTPDDKDIYYFLGSAYYGLGQFALAHDYYKRVDRGQYVPVAQSGAQKTEKAARNEYKRRLDMLKNEVNNEVRSEAKKESESGNSSSKANVNSLEF